jgi:2-succinyl-6-hydroxy-2,4-cyclohexadiene-1-carboxylate synthase
MIQGSRGLISPFPSGGKVGKVVCINNSGGAIFSFLAAAKYKNSSSPDFFTPLLDTPHDINISLIAEALLTGEVVVDGLKRQAVRVSNATELRAALADSSIFFIECVDLPSHEMNVQIHKDLNAMVTAKIVAALKKPILDGLHWSLYSKKHQLGSSKLQVVESKPLVVLLHGWLGSEADWKAVVGDFLDQKCWSVLTVSTDCELHSPTLFCHALRELIHQQISVSGDPRPLIIIGYSQGGRLGMHYRNLFPRDVRELVCISTVSGKPIDSGEFESSVIDLWESSRDGANEIEVFLNKWYALPVFSNFRKRLSSAYSELVTKRVEGFLDVDFALTNMACTSITANAKAELCVVGSLDTKYTALALTAKMNAMVDEIITIKNCGHCLLAEKPEALKSVLGDFLRRVLDPSKKRPADSAKGVKQVAVCKVSITQIDIRLQTPLIVLSNGTTQTFESRRGMRVVITVSELENKLNFKEKVHFSGVGEVYEPVFAVSEPNLSYNGLVDEIFSLSSVIEQWSGIVPPSAEGVANAVRNALLPIQDRYSAVCVYGFEQCLLHAMAQFMRVSLVDAIGAYIGASLKRRSSHIKVNGFASLRDGQSSGFSRTKKNFKSMKLKVGSSNGDNADQDAEQVNAFVASTATSSCERKGWLRLDANQSWSVDQARLFIEHLSPQALRAIDYVEEPLRFDCKVKDWQRLFLSPSLSGQSVDESDGVRISPLKISNATKSTWSDVSIAFDESLCSINYVNSSKNNSSSSSGSGSSGSSSGSGSKSPRKSQREETTKMTRLIEMHPSRTRFIIKPSLLSLRSDYLLSGWKEDSTFSNIVTISCTFECAAGLAFLVCIAAWYGDTAHGVHARADMAENDDFTRQFSDMLRPGQGGDMEIRVWEAEQLLNKIAVSYSNP